MNGLYFPPLRVLPAHHAHRRCVARRYCFGSHHFFGLATLTIPTWASETKKVLAVSGKWIFGTVTEKPLLFATAFRGVNIERKHINASGLVLYAIYVSFISLLY